MTVVSPENVEVSAGEFFPAALTAKVSPESNFRELDDAFLQTQTRIWLGEVLQIRLDEEMDIGGILADGKLLSELSDALSRMLPNLAIDPTHSKTNELKSFVSNKSTQRYMPYYNVGSFLKMCKNLGLDSIDLFTPSDVVEKRNTRKVCMCIRALSKRARSIELHVPDFDNVTCTLTMPTNMVECIRKSLEMSQSSSSLTDGREVDKVSCARFTNRISNSASTVSNEYATDLCDDAESNFIVDEFNGLSDHTSDAESPNMSSSEVIGEYTSALQLNPINIGNEEDDQCEYMSPSNGESIGSPCSQYFSVQEIVTASSDSVGSHISGKVDVNSEAKPKYENGDLLHIPMNLEDDHLDFEYQLDDRANSDESSSLSPDKQDADICDVHFDELTRSSEIGYENSSNYVLEDDSTSGIPVCSIDDSDIARHELVIGESICDGTVEDNSCRELIIKGDSCVSRTAEDLDLSGQMSISVEQSSCSVDSCPNSCESSILLHTESNGIVDPLDSPSFVDRSGAYFQLLHHNDTVVSAVTDSPMDKYDNEAFDAIYHDVMDIAASRSYTPQANSAVDMELVKDRKTGSEISQGTAAVPEDHRPLDKSNGGEVNIADGLFLNSIDETGHKCSPCVKDTEKGMIEDMNQVDAAKNKPKRKLLKSVAKGTALVGIAVYLLHQRKSRQENLSQLRKQPVDVLKQSTSAPWPKNGQKNGKIGSVYPAEKLNFGF